MHTAPLLKLLLHNTADFVWNETYTATFTTVEMLIYKDTTLHYSDMSKPQSLQVYTLKQRLCAGLLPEGKLSVFMSKPVIPVEQY